MRQGRETKTKLQLGEKKCRSSQRDKQPTHQRDGESASSVSRWYVWTRRTPACCNSAFTEPTAHTKTHIQPLSPLRYLQAITTNLNTHFLKRTCGLSAHHSRAVNAPSWTFDPVGLRSEIPAENNKSEESSETVLTRPTQRL